MQTVNDFAPKNKLIIFKTMNEIKTRTDILNFLIEKNNYKTYLEVGAQFCVNFNGIKINKKIGVDPNGDFKDILKLTSDKFFELNNQKFDIIFIDGLHESSQVKKDIENSLLILNEKGIIVLHDCNPTTKEIQEVPCKTREWTGDVWKAFVYYRQYEYLNMFVINTDWGCGIIMKGYQEPIKVKIEHLTWEYFCQNKNLWLNLKPVEYLKERFNK